MNKTEQLPANVLADLYSNSLVLIDDGITQKETLIEQTIKHNKKYFGNYKNRIVVLASDADNQHLNEADFNFLSEILNILL